MAPACTGGPLGEMANGGTITGFIGEGRLRWTILAGVLVVMNTAVSFWITNDGRDRAAQIAKETRDYANHLVETSVAEREGRAALEHGPMNASIARLEALITRIDQEHDAEERRQGDRMSAFVTYDALEQRLRRIEAENERRDARIEALQLRVYSNGGVR